ncbi:copper resistance CopC/CopD family protein [Streptomyces sp. NPDC058874]|uniref:copper resistance CopC/CopD family protein n=1 Tax=unclassified Streptomyces TaxID=2593676 RepID=UPI003695B791
MPSGSSSARRPSTVLALLAALCALLLGGAGPACAHAGLSGSDPGDGAVLTTDPRYVTLTFTESVGFVEDSLRVLSPRNERVNPRPAQHVDRKENTARVELSDDLPRGTYTVAWRVVSADGHPISGAFTFSLGEPSETSAVLVAGSPDGTAVGRLYGIFRYVAYSGMALLVGAAAVVLVCRPAAGAARPVRRLLVIGWTALAASTVALVLLRGPYETADAVTSVFDPAQLTRTVSGRPGGALVARLALLVLAAVLLKRSASRLGLLDDAPPARGPSARLRLACVLLAVALAFTWASAEHASTGLQVALAMPVAVVHLLAMGVWLGGLLTLLLLLRSRAPGGPAIPAAGIGRFSRLARTAVAVLVGTGAYQSWRQVGSWEALTTTSYGKTLVVKTVVVVLTLWVASFSRRWTARLVREAATGRTPTPALPERVPAAHTVGATSSPAGTGPGPASEAPQRDRRGDEPEPPAQEAGTERRGLRRTVAVEAALGVLILAITTLLTGTQPGRAAEGGSPAASAEEPRVKVVTVPFDMGKPHHRGTVQITLTPGQVGENTVEAVVFTADGGLAAVPELRLTLTQDDLGIGPLDARLKNQKGYWAAYDLQIPMPGEWILNITVRTTDIDQVTVRESVRVTPVPR